MKSVIKAETREIFWNNKIIANRGKKWKEAIVKGKLDSQINPSVLKMVRVNKNINQTQLANTLGVTLATYGGIERGIRKVKKERAQAIAKAVGKPLQSLFSAIEKNKFLAKKVSVNNA